MQSSPFVLAFLENLGTTELVMIFVVALLLFGNRLPEMARSFGKGIAEFKRSMRESTEQVTRELEQAAAPMKTSLEEVQRDVEKPLPEPDTVSRPEPPKAEPAPELPEKLPRHDIPTPDLTPRD